MTRYVELHKYAPHDLRREYWRGRIEEFIAQNAVSVEGQAQARAAALSLIQAARPLDKAEATA